MRIPSREDILRVIASVVQPLTRGEFEETKDLSATLKNLAPFGTGNNFQISAPFGLVAKAPKGVLAYCLNLLGNAQAPVILSQLHVKRPVPSAEGEVLLYSTGGTGDVVAILMKLGADGKLVIDPVTQFKVISNDVIFSGSSVKIGSSGSSEPLVLGTAFKTLYNAHTHTGNLGIPTGPPLVPMSSAHVSSKGFTEL